MVAPSSSLYIILTTSTTAAIPRIRHFHREVIFQLAKADKNKHCGSPTTYGNCHFRSCTDTCYFYGPKESNGSSDFSVHIPRLDTLLSEKIKLLPARRRNKFTKALEKHDKEIDKFCLSVKKATNNLAQEQRNLAATFAELIDDVLRAESPDESHEDAPVSNDEDDMDSQHQTHAYSQSEEYEGNGTGSSGDDSPTGSLSPLPTQLPPASQLTESQAEHFNDKFYWMQQQQMPDKSHKSPPHTGKDMPNIDSVHVEPPTSNFPHTAPPQPHPVPDANFYITDLPDVIQTSQSIHQKARVCDTLPLFDKTPQDKRLQDQTTQVEPSSKSYTPKPSFDTTPITPGLDGSRPKFDETPRADPDVTPRPEQGRTPCSNSKSEASLRQRYHTVLRLRELLCTDKHALPSTKLMQHGDTFVNGSDVADSFMDGKPLQPFLMEFYMRCLRDDVASMGSTESRRSIFLTPTISAILDWEATHRKDSTHIPFDDVALLRALDCLLPSEEALLACNTIFLPMFHKRHWSVYAINLALLRIDILDPNPYGPDLPHTLWQDFHKDTVQNDCGKYTFCKLAGIRLATAIQKLRPKALLRNFANFPFHYQTNCPTMAPGSNDSGFYAMIFLRSYDASDGTVTLRLDPTQSAHLRSELLHHLLFHKSNEVKNLHPEVAKMNCRNLGL